MRLLIDRRAICAVAGLAVSFVAVTSATHSWGGYHWARTTPQFTLKLGNNLTTADWSLHLSQTSSDWNSGNSAVLTAIVAGRSGNRRCGLTLLIAAPTATASRFWWMASPCRRSPFPNRRAHCC